MIPSWNLSGLIPPIRPGEQGQGQDRSPYNATLSEMISHFGATTDRLVILSGLLNYRQALYKLNIVEGFQWLDGSFVEDVETLQERSPNDVDVVTFFKLPAEQSQESLWNQIQPLFDIEQTKQNFRVDGYPMVLADALEEWHVHQICYWYSMWSHTRDQRWKGFIRVDLDPNEDGLARQLLERMQRLEAEF